jgi:antagonist of KipI
VSLEVLAPGPLTTVQDLGRPGLGALGVPASGAFDRLACRAANRLVGNPDGAAVLEATLAGPTLRATADHVLAGVGEVELALEGRPAPAAETLHLPAGATLAVGRVRRGARAYVAVAGGIDVPATIGSRATHPAAELGGLGGRALASGDVLPVGPAPEAPLRRRLRPGALPEPGARVRAVPGPDEEALRPGALERLLVAAWRVTPRADRTGIRLAGEPVPLAGSAERDPGGLVPGCVQVPGDGLPIVLGPDGPTTGGYPAVATVVAADLPLLAQARPGDTLRFVPATPEQGRAAWRERLRALEEGIEVIGS